MTAQPKRKGISPAWMALALLAMALLVWVNGRPESAGLIPAPRDKLAHALVFGGLGVLLVLSGLGYWLGFCIMVAFGAFDELRQMSLPGRHASWSDFGTDVLAAAIVFSLAGWFGRRGHGRQDGIDRTAVESGCKTPRHIE